MTSKFAGENTVHFLILLHAETATAGLKQKLTSQYAHMQKEVALLKNFIFPVFSMGSILQTVAGFRMEETFLSLL